MDIYSINPYGFVKPHLMLSLTNNKEICRNLLGLRCLEHAMIIALALIVLSSGYTAIEFSQIFF